MQASELIPRKKQERKISQKHKFATHTNLTNKCFRDFDEIKSARINNPNLSSWTILIRILSCFFQDWDGCG